MRESLKYRVKRTIKGSTFVIEFVRRRNRELRRLERKRFRFENGIKTIERVWPLDR